MFIDFVDVEMVCQTELFGKIFYINKINIHLILDDILGQKI